LWQPESFAEVALASCASIHETYAAVASGEVSTARAPRSSRRIAATAISASRSSWAMIEVPPFVFGP